MKKWLEVSLGELVINLDSKRKPITKIDRKNGPYPYYGATGILDYVDSYIFNEPLVLVGEDGAKWNKGEQTAFLAEGKYWVNNHVHALRPIEERLLSAYLIFYLNSIDLSPYITGITVPKLNQSKLNSIKILLPPILEQIEIVSKLQAANELKKKREEANKKMETFAPALFYEMFGDPGKNEKGWETKRLIEICDLINGKAFKPTDWSNVGTPIIRIQNLNDASKPYNCFEGDLPEKYRVHSGDILFSWSGTPGTSFGCFKWMGAEGWLNQHIFKIVFKTDVADEYFVYWLNSQLELLIGMAHGGVGLQHVTKGMVDQLIVPLPPIDFQRQFTLRVAELRTLQEKQDESRKKLENIFESMLSVLF